MRKEVLNWAKEKNNGNKWNIWKVILIIMVIYSIIMGIAIGTSDNTVTIERTDDGIYFNAETDSPLVSIMEIALLPVSIGFIAYVVAIIKENEYQIEMIFSKYKNFFKILLSNILVSIYVFLWTLLLIVPGIIKALSYFLVNYTLADSDYDNLSVTERLDLSKRLMEGHKMELFLLYVHYFIMSILAVFTLGIYYIWLVPEATLAFGKFATNLLEEDKKN